jgi:hypothetical protein
MFDTALADEERHINKVHLDALRWTPLVEVDPIGWTKNRPFLDGAAG